MEDKKIIAELNQIKSTGTVKDIPVLIKSLNHKNEEIKTLALNILSDIKYNDAVKIIINEIKNNKNEEIKTKLVSVCWQSGLDFSDAFDLFVDTAINGSLELCIESLSAIEDIIFHKKHKKEDVEKAIKLLKNTLPVENREKNELLNSLLQILKENL